MKGLLVVFAVACTAGLVSCGRDYTWKCKGKEMMNINELYDAVDQCKAEGVKDPFCVSVCKSKKMGLLEPATGNINETELYRRPDHHLPAEEAPILVKKFKDCYKHFNKFVHRSVAGDDAKNEPPYCFTRYFSYWTCIWVAAMTTCDAQFDPDVIGSDKILLTTKA